MDIAGRQRWVNQLHRADPKKPHVLLQPRIYDRVCSIHFPEGQPTIAHPDPILMTGTEDRQTHTLEETPAAKRRRLKGTPPRSTLSNRSRPTKRKLLATPPSPVTTPMEEVGEAEIYSKGVSVAAAHFIILLLVAMYRRVKIKCTKQEKEIAHLKSQLAQEKRRNARPIHQPRSSAIIFQKIKFFTGLSSLAVFENLHNLFSPFVRRRWKGLANFKQKTRQFHKSPQKFGPLRKLSSKEELLLVLMKLRLGLLNEDLSERFGISVSLCSQVFHSWLSVMAKMSKHFVFWPSREQVLACTPERFKSIPNLRIILDCTEIFIETPKNFNLQSLTWSNYKHHNTAKILVGVAPNSSITFLSKAYGGRMSDKAIVMESNIFNLMQPDDTIMADKGFLIHTECKDHGVHLYLPPGKRGEQQMTTAAVAKTKKIANRRILVEQVIRRLKTFRILRHQLPISHVPYIDQIVLVCASLSNLMVPIYNC